MLGMLILSRSEAVEKLPTEANDAWIRFAIDVLRNGVRRVSPTGPQTHKGISLFLTTHVKPNKKY